MSARLTRPARGCSAPCQIVVTLLVVIVVPLELLPLTAAWVKLLGTLRRVSKPVRLDAAAGARLVGLVPASAVQRVTLVSPFQLT
jgi:hypothetical protein